MRWFTSQGHIVPPSQKYRATQRAISQQRHRSRRMLTNPQPTLRAPKANQIRDGSTSAKLLNFLFLTCGPAFDQTRSSRSSKSVPSPTDRSKWWMLGDLSSMSAVAPHRSMLRHTRFIARQTTRRHASTTEAAKNTAAKTKETASNVQSKASQGLSRVTTSASSGLSRASQGISNAISRIGGRTGRLISFVECELNFSCDQLGSLGSPLV